jgi:hypothetical protein
VRTFLSHLLLAVALLVAQTGGVVHGLSHSGEPAGHRDAHHSPQQAQQCDLCHAFAAADAADAPARQPSTEFAVGDAAPPAQADALVAASDPPPYSGRAPPSIS